MLEVDEFQGLAINSSVGWRSMPRCAYAPKLIWYASTVAITNCHGIMMRGDMQKKVSGQIHP